MSVKAEFGQNPPFPSSFVKIAASRSLAFGFLAFYFRPPFQPIVDILE